MPSNADRRRLFDHEHGQVNNLCTHPDCQRAWSRRSKQWKVEAHRGIRRITADADVLDKIQDHIHALEAAGWSRRAIAGAAGISATAVSRLGNHAQAHVRHTTARAILTLKTTDLPKTPTRDATEPFVPKTGTVRRIQALLFMGWTHTVLAQRSGVKTAVVVNQSGRWVTRSTHDKVAALYDQLAMTVGPSEVNRQRARKLGYRGPLDWDDIDTDTEPAVKRRSTARSHADVDEVLIQRILTAAPSEIRALAARTTKTEKHTVTARWLEAGRSQRELEQLTGWNVTRYTPRQEHTAA